MGFRDEALSQKLLDSTLTLEKAKIAIWQREAIAEQQTELKEGSKTNPILVEHVTKSPFATASAPSAAPGGRQYGQQWFQRSVKAGAVHGRSTTSATRSPTSCDRCGGRDISKVRDVQQ